MSQNHLQHPFASWLSPTQRALHSTTPTPVMALQRRPFSRPNLAVWPVSDSALPKAEIFLFTGSNTPYQSHE